jgi:hypothetical protein
VRVPTDLRLVMTMDGGTIPMFSSRLPENDFRTPLIQALIAKGYESRISASDLVGVWGALGLLGAPVRIPTCAHPPLYVWTPPERSSD